LEGKVLHVQGEKEHFMRQVDEQFSQISNLQNLLQQQTQISTIAQSQQAESKLLLLNQTNTNSHNDASKVDSSATTKVSFAPEPIIPMPPA